MNAKMIISYGNIPTTKKITTQIIIVIIGLILTTLVTVLASNNTKLALVLSGLFVIIFRLTNPEKLFCFWLAFSPVLDYLLRYPEQQAIITCSRFVVMLLVISVVARLLINKNLKLNFGWFELSWTLFASYALADCLLHGNFSFASLKIAIDGFILPLVFYLIIRYGLHFQEIKENILIALIVLAYLILPVGVYELVTGIDLFAYPGGQLIFDGVIRPNGAFVSDNSYALIALILGITLMYWPTVINIKLVGRYKWLWQGAVISAFLSALIPQFRAVMVAMIVSLLLGRWMLLGWKSLVKPILLSIILILAGIPIWLALSTTQFYQGRIADTANFSSRIMTYKKALEVAKNNPMGVGLGNYENYFNQRWAIKEQPEKEKLGQLTQSTPHSNFLSVLAELGILGLILYLVAHIALLKTAWQAARLEGSAKTAGVLVILLVFIYAGVGLTLTSGYYYDLNQFFFCCVGVLLVSLQEETYHTSIF